MSLRMFSTIAAILVVATVPSETAAAEDADAATTVHVEQTLAFEMPGGGSVDVAAGRYTVSITARGHLGLTPAGGGTPIVVDAANGFHEEEIDREGATLIRADDGVRWHLAVLKPDGEIAEAVATVGVETRGKRVRLSKAKLQKATAQKWTKKPHLLAKPGPVQMAQPIRAPASGSYNVPGPDLVFDGCVVRCKDNPSLGYYPADGCEGGYTTDLHYRIGSTLKNGGDAAATFEQGWKVVSNGVTASLAMGGGLYLAPGAELSGNDSYAPAAATSQLEVGTHEFTFVADPDNKIVEASENNNQHTCSLTVVQGAGAVPDPTDLRIPSVSVSPSSGPPDAGFVVSASVQNGGEQPTNATIRVTCSPGGTKMISGLGVGESVEVTMSPLNYPIAPGNQTATCTVDPYDSIEESDENNNEGSRSFTVVE